jgi:hypothetical protein
MVIKNTGRHQMEQKHEFTIAFEGLEGAAANIAAHSLMEAITGLGEPDLTVATKKQRQDTQDLGATLVLIFGTPVAISLARGIAGWIRRRADMTTVVVRDKQGNELLRYSGEGKDLDKLTGVLQATHGNLGKQS